MIQLQFHLIFFFFCFCSSLFIVVQVTLISLYYMAIFRAGVAVSQINGFILCFGIVCEHYYNGLGRCGNRKCIFALHFIWFLGNNQKCIKLQQQQQKDTVSPLAVCGSTRHRTRIVQCHMAA